jgi:hypothetical protein
MSPDSISGGQVGSHERYGSTLGTGYRRAGAEPSTDSDRLNGTAYELTTDKPRLPSLDPEAPAEPQFTDPQFSADSWLDGPTGSLADHPLLRGLLLELPPKGTVPPPGWLDRWFEATRSILELLYVK